MRNSNYVVQEKKEKFNWGFLVGGSLTKTVNEDVEKKIKNMSEEQLAILAAQGKLSKNAQELYDKLKELKDEEEAINKEAEEFTRYQKELFTGTTAQSLTGK